MYHTNPWQHLSDKSLFSLKRKEHIETAEKVWEIDDYAKQFKTITFLMDAIFPVCQPWLNQPD